ncbi:hypothetical protein XI25_04410 [Paenibacillus sp. DMB20]|nr:hypothetical protein XI25_04410 [Paenibacillus sp. DMB20]
MDSSVYPRIMDYTNNRYQFFGESEHWEAKYAYQGTEIRREVDRRTTYSNEDSYKFTLKYKGPLEELSPIQKLEYSYETKGGNGKRIERFAEPPKEAVFTSEGSSKGGAKVSEDEVIQVNVKWDGFEESFELRNKNK